MSSCSRCHEAGLNPITVSTACMCPRTAAVRPCQVRWGPCLARRKPRAGQTHATPPLRGSSRTSPQTATLPTQRAPCRAISQATTHMKASSPRATRLVQGHSLLADWPMEDAPTGPGLPASNRTPQLSFRLSGLVVQKKIDDACDSGRLTRLAVVVLPRANSDKGRRVSVADHVAAGVYGRGAGWIWRR